MKVELNNELMPSNINKAVSFNTQLRINTDTGSLIPLVYVSSSMESSPASGFHNNGDKAGLTVIRKSGEWESTYFPHYCGGIAGVGGSQGGFLIPHYSQPVLNAGGFTGEGGIYGTDKLMCKNNDTNGKTFTPTIACIGNEAAPTVTYTNQRGRYCKIGRLVFVSFYIRAKITALNGTNNYGCIAGLPFNSTTELGTGATTCPYTIMYSCMANENNMSMSFLQGTNRIQIFYNYAQNANKGKVTTTNYMEIGGQGWYGTDTID